MVLRILPDLLSILVDLIGKRVVFTLENGREVEGILQSANRDMALVVYEDDDKLKMNYVNMSSVILISREEAKRKGSAEAGAG